MDVLGNIPRLRTVAIGAVVAKIGYMGVFILVARCAVQHQFFPGDSLMGQGFIGSVAHPE
ncbi:MAG: hypothetical protein COA73_08620 [Candidatus Hydrogenedentota bacterium]|nr:MAG: hypothetical protein COA73_08620 [Candidatus Hydrogenedentota bacterium]